MNNNNFSNNEKSDNRNSKIMQEEIINKLFSDRKKNQLNTFEKLQVYINFYIMSDEMRNQRLCYCKDNNINSEEECNAIYSEAINNFYKQLEQKLRNKINHSLFSKLFSTNNKK